MTCGVRCTASFSAVVLHLGRPGSDQHPTLGGLGVPVFETKADSIISISSTTVS